jgi:hypothetical protein
VAGVGGSALRGLCLEYWILDPHICMNLDPDSTISFVNSQKNTSICGRKCLIMNLAKFSKQCVSGKHGT